MRVRSPLIAVASLFITAGAGWYTLSIDGAGGQMVQAARAFADSLSSSERATSTMSYDDAARLDWHFIPKETRKGLQIKQMSAAQRKAAHALLHAGLSEIGYEKATVIMTLESILHELEKSRERGAIRDAERYYFTVFGDPAAVGRWGWSVEGHHVSLNFVVEDGKLVAATPAFFGANPAVVRSDVAAGPKTGTRTLAKEETIAFELLGSLSDEQQQAAVIAADPPREIRAAGAPQPPQAAPQGLRAARMSAQQRRRLRSLIEVYAGNMPEEISRAWLKEIDEAGFENVHFAWAGAKRPGVGHYYVLQGPTFLVEFINVQRGDNLPANHIHSVWRNLAGDFGVAL